VIRCRPLWVGREEKYERSVSATSPKRRGRGDLILRKGANHLVEEVALRKV